MSDPAVLLVVAAPSGAGKSTLCKRLLAAHPGLALSVSHTTRSARPGEAHGREYFFVDDAAFDALVAAEGFVEWFQVHDHRYGTARATVEAAQSSGKDLLFDVDVCGAAALRSAYPSVISVFIVPPSLEVLERRLRDRGTDDEATVRLRLGRAHSEIQQAPTFDYLVVNDALEQAVADLGAIYRAASCATGRRASLLRGLCAPRRA